MKKAIALATGILFTITTFAQTTIKTEDISKHLNDSVTVCDKVYGGIFLDRAKNTPTFLNVGGSYPNNPLTLVIWADVRATFTEKPEEYYKDKTICVSGKVEEYKGKMQIVIRSKEQIAVSP